MAAIETIKGVAVDADALAGKGYLAPTAMSDAVTLPYFMAVARAYYQASGDARDAAATMLNGSSVTSNSIGTGAKSFGPGAGTVGKGWAIGSPLMAFSLSAPTNAMFGKATSYDPLTGALVMTVPLTGSTSGTGTFTDWVIVPCGLPGPTGATGSVWYSGSGVPSGGTGVDGDYYLRSVVGDVYLKSAEAWAVVANILGPQGIQGIQGITGSGSNIHASKDGVGITAAPRSRINAIGNGVTVADNAGSDRIELTIQIPAMSFVAAFKAGVI